MVLWKCLCPVFLSILDLTFFYVNTMLRNLISFIEVSEQSENYKVHSVKFL